MNRDMIAHPIFSLACFHFSLVLGGVLAGVLGVFMVGALWGVRTFSTDDSQAASFCEACMNVAGALLENVHEMSRGDCPGTVPGLSRDSSRIVPGPSWGCP